MLGLKYSDAMRRVRTRHCNWVCVWCAMGVLAIGAALLKVGDGGAMSPSNARTNDADRVDDEGAAAFDANYGKHVLRTSVPDPVCLPMHAGKTPRVLRVVGSNTHDDAAGNYVEKGTLNGLPAYQSNRGWWLYSVDGSWGIDKAFRGVPDLQEYRSQVGLPGTFIARNTSGESLRVVPSR